MDLKEVSFRSHPSHTRHPWETARAAVVEKLLARTVWANGRAGRAILDIGCGDCFVIQQIAQAHPACRFVGVDPALPPDLIKDLPRTTAIPQLEIYRALESVPQTSGQVDIVLLLDVLEHVEQPAALLRTLADNPMVTKDTVYLITVPAFQPLFCCHDRFLMHFHRYNRPDLTAMVSAAGLSVRHTGYFFTSLLLPRLLQVALEKSKLWSPPEGTGVTRWKGHGLLDRLLSQLLLADFAVTDALQRCGLTMPGLTCYAICQK